MYQPPNLRPDDIRSSRAAERIESDFVDRAVRITIRDGRLFEGRFACVDSGCNIILSEAAMGQSSVPFVELSPVRPNIQPGVGPEGATELAKGQELWTGEGHGPGRGNPVFDSQAHEAMDQSTGPRFTYSHASQLDIGPGGSSSGSSAQSPGITRLLYSRTEEPAPSTRSAAARRINSGLKRAAPGEKKTKQRTQSTPGDPAAGSSQRLLQSSRPGDGGTAAGAQISPSARFYTPPAPPPLVLESRRASVSNVPFSQTGAQTRPNPPASSPSRATPSSSLGLMLGRPLATSDPSPSPAHFSLPPMQIADEVSKLGESGPVESQRGRRGRPARAATVSSRGRRLSQRNVSFLVPQTPGVTSESSAPASSRTHPEVLPEHSGRVIFVLERADRRRRSSEGHLVGDPRRVQHNMPPPPLTPRFTSNPGSSGSTQGPALAESPRSRTDLVSFRGIGSSRVQSQRSDHHQRSSSDVSGLTGGIDVRGSHGVRHNHSNSDPVPFNQAVVASPHVGTQHAVGLYQPGWNPMTHRNRAFSSAGLGAGPYPGFHLDSAGVTSSTGQGSSQDENRAGLSSSGMSDPAAHVGTGESYRNMPTSSHAGPLRPFHAEASRPGEEERQGALTHQHHQQASKEWQSRGTGPEEERDQPGAL
ncbi:hypothetical protein FA10DRAFT_11561 [Acaromyces ingoldii]|uniref:LSM domain-containing protein n=1 Tax=Acaromyces ingoldii TaxID=215250 RepID=A0A316YTU3_9BASI|nr:hypothetical protein FA10DRAFT_11561 [Acaromyces ingoldii]PWN92990.1 hypothetical protein FA10DRAFT_11561 [Acaromyces ingoldii]